jgi:hydrogenase maturation protease
MSSFAILGIGNNLLTDDGAGIHALRHFDGNNSDPAVRCLDGGTVGLALLDRLCELDGLIAIDAMRLGKAPGTVTVLENEAMDECLRNHHGSAHEVGLSDLMDALRLSGELPARRALIGIEPEAVGWGTRPTPPIAAAVPKASAAAEALIAGWRGAGLRTDI